MSRPKTRMNGEGSVFIVRTKHGVRYRATKTLYRTDSGSYPKVSGQGSTPAQAIERREANLLKWQVKLGVLPVEALGRTPSELRITTAQWLWQWWGTDLRAKVANGKMRASTHAQYGSRIRLHLCANDGIGSVPLRLLTSDKVEELFYSTLPGRKKVVDGKLTDEPALNPTAIRNTYYVLKKALDAAVRKRLITHNPVAAVEVPRRAPRRDEGIDRLKWVPLHLLKALEGDEDEALWLTAMMLGLRQSERLGLTDDCVSFGRDPSKRIGTITIKQQLSRLPTQHGCGSHQEGKGYPCGRERADRCPQKEGGGLYINPTTKSGNIRVLPLVEPLYSVLRAHLKKVRAARKKPDFAPLPGEKMDKLVFPGVNGRPRRHQADNRAFQELLRKNGIDPLRPHILRHLSITLLIELGASLDVVRQIAGHSKVAMTIYYSHQSKNAAAEPLKEMGRYLIQRQERYKELEEAEGKKAKRKRQPKVDVDAIEAENAILRAEVDQLREELERLKAAQAESLAQ